MWLRLTEGGVRNLRSILGQVGKQTIEQPHLFITPNMAESATRILKTIDRQSKNQPSSRPDEIQYLKQWISILGAIVTLQAILLATK